MFTITLIEQRHLEQDVRLFSFTRPSGFSWQAGQHVVLFLDSGEERALSIVTAPHEETIDVVTHCSPEGSSFKRQLADLQPGQTVTITPAAGEFCLPQDVTDPLFVVSGVGIGAVRAIIRDRLHRKISLGMEVLYYADPGLTLFKSEFLGLMKTHPEFRYRHIPSDIKEAGHIKDVETRGTRRIFMSGVYLQQEGAPKNVPGPATPAEREEAAFADVMSGLID